MASAVAEVFDTAELLEMILLKLPTRDLLLSQRVTKYWKALIESSTKLQEALVFRALLNTRGAVCTTTQFWNKLFSQSTDGSGDSSGDGCCYRAEDGRVHKNIRVVKNSLLQPLLCLLDAMHSTRGSAFFLHKLSPSWQYPTASWRRMTLCHPPIHVYGRVLLLGSPYSAPPSLQQNRIDTGSKDAGAIVEDLEQAFASSAFENKEYELSTTCVNEDGSPSYSLTISGLGKLESNHQLEEMKAEIRAIKRYPNLVVAQ